MVSEAVPEKPDVGVNFSPLRALPRLDRDPLMVIDAELLAPEENDMPVVDASVSLP
jgi:hypothetical protein